MHPDDVVGAAQIGEGLGELGWQLRLRVAERRDDEQARRATGSREVAEEEQRRRVGPVAVLEHQQERTFSAHAGEQLGDRRVEAVALGVRVGLGRRRQLADPRRQVAHEPDELAAATAERRSELLRVDGPDELVEGVDERSVRRANHRVAGAGEHEHSLGRRLGGQLPHEPALARSGLAAEQHDTPALALAPRDQRPQLLELDHAADERERRGWTERTGECLHMTPLRTIVRSDHARP